MITVSAGANKNDGSDHTFENPAAYGKFVLKKVDQDGKAIAATFDLYQWDTVKSDWGDPIGTITTPQRAMAFTNPASWHLANISLLKPLHLAIR